MKGERSLRARLLTSIILLGMICTTASARTIYVDDDGPADFNTIQDAINDSNDGDTIIVADGTYTGLGNRDIDFLGKAITVCSENGPESCIIDCDSSETEYHRGFYFHSGEDANSVLDGFTITNGYADTNGGGGIDCFKSSPMISNCIIRGNVAPLIRLQGLWGVVLSFNNGGGIHISWSSPIITNCFIMDNRVTGNGGGIGLYSSSPIISNCVIAGNIALHKGFGLGGAIHSNRSSPTIINCTVIENVAEERGGGIYCLRTGNPTITNSIFWANLPHEIYVSTGAPSTLVVAYSNVQDGWAGEVNIDVDPCFAFVGFWDPNENPEDPNDDFWVEGDYHLLTDSPSIDAGDPNYIDEPNETDLDGKPRVIGGRIDMGAYEYMHPVPAQIRIVPRTINPASKGKWIAAFLQLPEDYNVADIDPDTVLLQGEIEPQRFWFAKRHQIAIAIFSRKDIQTILEVGEIKLTITGWLVDGTAFEGTDVIRVLNKGGGKAALRVKIKDEE